MIEFAQLHNEFDRLENELRNARQRIAELESENEKLSLKLKGFENEQTEKQGIKRPSRLIRLMSWMWDEPAEAGRQ